MALFSADSLVFLYSNVETAKQWWIKAFDGKAMKVPSEWDNPLPSDVAIRLPGYSEPTILLSDRAEAQQAGLDQSATVAPIIFCDKINKAQEWFSGRGIIAGPIQEDSETQFFEIRDLEGNSIEICKEP